MNNPNVVTFNNTGAAVLSNNTTITTVKPQGVVSTLSGGFNGITTSQGSSNVTLSQSNQKTMAALFRESIDEYSGVDQIYSVEVRCEKRGLVSYSIHRTESGAEQALQELSEYYADDDAEIEIGIKQMKYGM